MKKEFTVFAYNDKDDKLEVYRSNSLDECVSVAIALFKASDLEMKILNLKGQTVVSFIRPLAVD